MPSFSCRVQRRVSKDGEGNSNAWKEKGRQGELGKGDCWVGWSILSMGGMSQRYLRTESPPLRAWCRSIMTLRPVWATRDPFSKQQLPPNQTITKYALFFFLLCSVRAPSRSSSISPLSVCLFKGRGSPLHQLPVKLEANVMGIQPLEKVIQFQCGYCTSLGQERWFGSVLSPFYVLLWTLRLISTPATSSFFFLFNSACPPLTGLGYLLITVQNCMTMYGSAIDQTYKGGQQYILCFAHHLACIVFFFLC